MPYDPERHHRRSIRLPGYDYTQPGAYFVTLCVHREVAMILGDVVDGKMVLTPAGEIAAECWQAIPQHFAFVTLDAWVIMPNHMHGILVFGDDGTGDRRGCRGEALPRPYNAATAATAANPTTATATTNAATAATATGDDVPSRPTGAPAGSLGAVVGAYKSAVTKRINQLRNTPGGVVWQRNYYERIIRSERALHAIRSYIEENPRRWTLDHYHPAPTGPDPQAMEVWRLLQADDLTASNGEGE